MSESSEINRYLMRNPMEAALVARGLKRPPQATRVTSPLIELLESIPPRERLGIRRITLGPKLGYAGAVVFENGEQLLRWLKPKEYLIGTESTPAEARRDRRFTAKLQRSDLLAAAIVPLEKPKARD